MDADSTCPVHGVPAVTGAEGTSITNGVDWYARWQDVRIERDDLSIELDVARKAHRTEKTRAEAAEAERDSLQARVEALESVVAAVLAALPPCPRNAHCEDCLRRGRRCTECFYDERNLIDATRATDAEGGEA